MGTGYGEYEQAAVNQTRAGGNRIFRLPPGALQRRRECAENKGAGRPWLNRIEHQASNLAVGGSSPPGRAIQACSFGGILPNSPLRRSFSVCWISSRVFITKGP